MIDLPVVTQLLIFGAFFFVILMLAILFDFPPPIRNFLNYIDQLTSINNCISRTKFFLGYLGAHILMVGLPLITYLCFDFIQSMPPENFILKTSALLFFLLALLILMMVFVISLISIIIFVVQRMHDIGISGKWYLLILIFPLLDTMSNQIGLSTFGVLSSLLYLGVVVALIAWPSKTENNPYRFPPEFS